MVSTLAGIAALIVLLLAVILLAQGHLEGPLIRYVATRSQRQIKVEGAFQVDLLTVHPRIVAEKVIIGNPSWMPPGVTAEIGHLELTYSLPTLTRSSELLTLRMEQATLHLTRDIEGHSNWQARPPGSGRGTGPPLIHSLRMPNARVYFDDARRHLKFDGILTAQDLPGGGPTPALRIEGAGQLNDRPANFTLNGDPLATVTRGHPYQFEFVETSSGTRLTGKGSVPRPFDFHYLELTFESNGEDLKDLYFLVGINLPETGAYRLTGKFAREDHQLAFTDLQATSGRSDMHGKVLVETKRGGAPSHMVADLQSQLLRASDLGAQAAGRAPRPAGGKRLLLSDTPFHLQGARRSDAEFDFHAQALEMGRETLGEVVIKVKIDAGTIVVAPVSATLREGKLTGGVKIDVSRDVPAADVDLRINHMKLGGSAADRAAKPPPFDGPLQVRVAVRGRGNSLHDMASTAKGTVTAVLPHGVVRSSVAELAGFDLRGVGLLAAGTKSDTGIRCGVASFDVGGGTLTAQRLLVDTDPVLITGEGTINLDSEAIDLQLEGRPKHPRLRVRAPVLVRGTLAHPAFSIEAKKPMAQAGGAIALGVLLTPVAAMLAFVDPGLAKDSDCGALLAEVHTGRDRIQQ